MILTTYLAIRHWRLKWSRDPGATNGLYIPKCVRIQRDRLIAQLTMKSGGPWPTWPPQGKHLCIRIYIYSCKPRGSCAHILYAPVHVVE